jgi:hypothetical protein
LVSGNEKGCASAQPFSIWLRRSAAFFNMAAPKRSLFQYGCAEAQPFSIWLRRSAAFFVA